MLKGRYFLEKKIVLAKLNPLNPKNEIKIQNEA
jgi:hypothetical protein